MDVRYEGVGEDPDLVLTDDLTKVQASKEMQKTAYMGVLSDLLTWHHEDPPDAREHRRNEAVYVFQGNRNPFIDHPEYAWCLYRDVCPMSAP